jgi:hypothetical protein
MKKLIFTLCVAAATPFVALQAQNTPSKVSLRSGNVIDNNTTAPKAPTGFGKAGAIYEWYSYPTFLQDAQILGTAGSVIFMGHDSLAKYVGDDDTIRYDQILLSAGAILDPKDDVIDNSANPELKLTKYTGYSVDSLAFRYLYCRYNDSIDDGQGGKNGVVDTLFIFTFKTPAIIERTTTDGDKFGYMSWNTATRYPTGYSTIDTVLLTLEDTTTLPDAAEASWRTGVFEMGFKNPLNVPKVQSGVANNLFGFLAVFKSGIVYDSSFTYIHQGTGPKPTSDKRINYFGVRNWSDDNANPYQNTAFFNTTLFSPTFAAYPNTQNYIGTIPGSLLYTRPAYLDAYFKVNALSTGINDITNDQFAMGNVYPNPALANGTALISFSVKNTSNVNVAIYNIAGVQVKSVVNKNFAAGEHAEEISLSGLKAGIYFVNMTVNGSTITKKLTITE